MSCLLQTSFFNGILPNDDRAQMPSYSSAPQRMGPDVLWDRSGMLSSSGAGFWGNLSIGDVWDYQSWATVTAAVGQRRDGITGITRDINGNPIGNVTVKMFDKLTDLLVDTVTSDANGNFTATTPFTGQQVYMRAVNAGNTLSGATAALTPS